MKKICLVGLLALSWIQFFAQLSRDKEFHIRLGYGAGGYGNITEIKYNLGGSQLAWTDTSGAATVHVPIELRLELHPRINVGLDMKFGRYLYDPEEDNAGKSNRFSVIGVAAEANLVNRDKFRWYVGLGVNVGHLEVTETKGIGVASYKEASEWRGGGLRLNTGVMYFFGDGPIAINSNLGFLSHNLQLQSIRRNDTSVALTNWSGELRLAGVEFNLGLVWRLRY